MKIFKTTEQLPPDLTWVVAHYVGDNWIDTKTINPGGQYWKVVRFERGLSQRDRDALPDCERRRTHKAQDVGFNNEVPYYWDEFGPGKLFGQDVDMWFHLPGDE